MATVIRLRPNDIGGNIGRAFGEGFSQAYDEAEDEQEGIRKGAEMQSALDDIIGAGNPEGAMQLLATKPKYRSMIQSPEDLSMMTDLVKGIYERPEGKTAKSRIIKTADGAVKMRVMNDDVSTSLSNGEITFEELYGAEFAGAEFATEADEAVHKERLIHEQGEELEVIDGATGSRLGTVNSRALEKEPGLIDKKWGPRALLNGEFERGRQIDADRRASGVVEVFGVDPLSGEEVLRRRESADGFDPSTLGPDEFTASVLAARKTRADINRANSGKASDGEPKSDDARIAEGRIIRRNISSGAKDRDKLTSEEQRFLEQANAKDTTIIKKDLTKQFRLIRDDSSGLIKLLDNTRAGDPQRLEVAESAVKPLLDAGLTAPQARKAALQIGEAIEFMAYDINTEQNVLTKAIKPARTKPPTSKADEGNVFETPDGKLRVLVKFDEGGNDQWFELDELGIE